jgi:hypothetical protein
VERVDRWHADVTEEIALLTSIDLGLRPGDHLKPAVQTGQLVLIGLSQLRGDPGPGLGQEHLDPLSAHKFRAGGEIGLPIDRTDC